VKARAKNSKEWGTSKPREMASTENETEKTISHDKRIPSRGELRKL